LNNGGSAITAYKVTPYIDSSAGTPVLCTSATSCILTGLVNGTSYTFTVVATNSLGASTASAPSNAVTPVTAPGAPTAVLATRGDSQVTLNWTAPSSNGGSAITSYKVTPYIASAAAAPVLCTSATSCVITGLVNGTTYTFTVSATSIVATSVATSPSSSVTPAIVPGAPTKISSSQVFLDANRLIVTWTAPSSNGGSEITSYLITPIHGSTSLTPVSCEGASTNCALPGLHTGWQYSFTVVAINDVGSSLASVASGLSVSVFGW
jgi:titin